MAHRPIIESNLNKLCALSWFKTRFLTTCLQERIITREQYEEIDQQKVAYNRNVLFYQILFQKDYEQFQKVMVIMADRETEQSGDVLRIFKSVIDNDDVVQSVVTIPERPEPTRALKERDVHWVVRHFMESPDMVEKQLIFYSALGLRLSELFDLQNSTRMSGTPSHNFFVGCLTKWIGQQPTQANFKKLIAILKDHDFNDVAEKIGKNPSAQDEDTNIAVAVGNLKIE